MAIDLTLSNLVRTLRDQFNIGKGTTHYLKRDGNDLKFKDPNNAEKTLTQLAAAGGGSSFEDTYTQVSHGIAQWKWVYNNAGTWTQSITPASILSNQPIGLVIAVTTDTLTIRFGGLVSRPSHGKTVGALYYATASGDDSTTPYINWTKPVMIPVDADTLLVCPQRESPTRVAVDSPSGDQDDYEPGNSTQWAECVAARLNPSVDMAITGFGAIARVYPQPKLLFNISTAYTIMLKHEDSSSSAANRIYNEGGGNHVIRPQTGAVIFYDPTSLRWRSIGLWTQPLAISDTIAAQADDYNPTGIDYADTLRVTLTGDQDITGLVAGDGNLRICIVNVDDIDVLTFKHEDASSTAANRFLCPGGFDIWLGPGESITWEYDGTTSRWRPIGHVPTAPIEREQHLPQPEQPVGYIDVSAYQNTPAPNDLRGAIYRTDRDIEFNRIALRRSTSATGTMRVVIYQAPNGEAIDGDWSKVYEGTFAWAGTGVIVHSTGSPVRLRKGRFAFLFGMTTLVYFWIDCYIIGAVNMINTTMPAEVYPGNFETSIDAGSTAPALFDPVADASADTGNHTPILRFRSS